MKKFKLGLGNVICGLDTLEVHPIISFRQGDTNAPHKVGTDLLIGDGEKPSELAEVQLEIVGLDGLIILKKYIKAIENNLKGEEELLQFFVEMDRIDRGLS